ncbi:unnamed protein product [Gongylonema pulchrum]|uniref:C2H2-type domain-containing protein n=1 Tax=Gongylonema pulchrum TaxID=637853 RepID=A0A183DVP3_9BILA|nr:unnamed protein product [Gongylonema pulchrum]
MFSHTSKHLLTEHQIVIVEADLIVDLKRYVEHWRQRITEEGVDKIFPKVTPVEGSPYYGTVDCYYEMSERLQEDYGLRQKLAMRRLEEVLACQQREREETNFQQQCIFCKHMSVGNRSKIIHHLYMIHHLNLGSPDNLGSEMAGASGISGSAQVLRKYRFWGSELSFKIIALKELGKRWLEVLAEDFEDTSLTFLDSDEEEEDFSCLSRCEFAVSQESFSKVVLKGREWQEDNINVEPTCAICLFCEKTEENAGPLLEHIKACFDLNITISGKETVKSLSGWVLMKHICHTRHHFDILGIIEKEKFDVYDRMSMINFIRKESYNGRCFVCGKGDFGGLLQLRLHFAEDNHLSKGLPNKSVWRVEELVDSTVITRY